MNITFDPSPRFKVGEVAEFIGNLCPEDLEELTYNYGTANPLNDFIRALELSDTHAMRQLDGKVLALGGIVPYSEPNVYGVWLLCTEEAFKYPKALYKYCKGILLGRTGLFGAFVYKPNKRHITFVTKGMGFTETDQEEGQLRLYIWRKNDNIKYDDASYEWLYKMS